MARYLNCACVVAWDKFSVEADGHSFVMTDDDT